MSDSMQLSQLIQDAGINDDAASTLQAAIDTLGPAIMAGLGAVQIDDITTSEVLLVTLLVDDSWSINAAQNAPAVRAGHNIVLDALCTAKQSASVLISCRYLNEGVDTPAGVIYPYVMLAGAHRLDETNYDPQGGTPLYDQTAATLTAVVAKMSEFEQAGITARAVTVIITDGADMHSRRMNAPSIAKIVGSLLASEQHIVIGMGIKDSHASVDFNEVFREMGLLDRWILTPGNTEREIRHAFQVVSQSAVQASQTMGSFSQTALGGFAS